MRIQFVEEGCGIVISNFFFQAEGGIRGLVRSRELGDVYKRQCYVVGYSRVTMRRA